MKKNEWLAMASLLGFFLFLWWSVRTGEDGAKWEGTGQVSIFPASSITKNYRLDANIEVTQKVPPFSPRTFSYRVISASFPGGDQIQFTNCQVSSLGSTSNCTDESGKGWQVEVSTAPLKPETD